MSREIFPLRLDSHPFNEDALYEAQEIAYDAWEEPNRQKQFALAKKALRVSPYCTDAYNILAQSTSSPAEAVKLYSQGIEAGEKALGRKFFKENEGHFWGIIETRPYMRGKAGLADCLWETGERQKAIVTLQEMLCLNPNDNQGIRYILINWLVSEDLFEEAERLITNYPESSAFMLYSAALLYFKQTRKVKARNALKKALKANPYVPEFLLDSGKSYIPTSWAEEYGYQQGHVSEASEYRNLASEFWREAPGALVWLKENITCSSLQWLSFQK